MARMSIDDMLGRDPRITVLASILGWSRRETAGCLVLDVWPICYDQRTHIVSERIIDAAAGVAGFAKAMVESELAHLDRSGKIRIRGARERIEYLERKSNAGRQGGLKSAEARGKYTKQTASTSQANVKQTSSTSGTSAQAPRNPSATASVPPSAPVPASDPPPAPPFALTPGGPPDGVPGRAEAIDAFHRAFKTRTNGVKPTWGPKQLGQMDGLLAKHSAAEVIRRIEILFTAPPAFLAASIPDMGTLVSNFDKLAQPAQSSARKSPTQIALEELERIESEES